MRLLRPWMYLGVVVMISLAACEPGTATVPSAPDVAIPIPATLACIAPVPELGAVTSFCADAGKGVGGVTYSDYSKYNNVGEGPAHSFLVGDSLPRGVSCNFDQAHAVATC